MRYRVYPYKQGSASARVLSRALGGLVLRREESGFSARTDDFIVNWGSSMVPRRVNRYGVLNRPEAVAVAGNKLRFFQHMGRELPHIIPEFWTSASDIPEDAFPIVCRTVLDGHSGRGIVIADTREQLVYAPLYVRYVKKRQEYRVHASRDGVISLQRKARSLEVADENVNWRVRNHSNGFVFAREGVEAPEDVTAYAISAVRSLGLDFGAVDVVYYDNSRDGQGAKVLEVNTAPGLEGSTVEDYVRFFTRTE